MLTEEWKSEARRRLQPPSSPRPWSTQIDLPEGTDPLVLVPDTLALARELAPPGWLAIAAHIQSGRGCTMAPRWRGWYLRLQYEPARGPARRPRWYITESAVQCYARLHPGAGHALAMLEELVEYATIRDRRDHLELWRSPRNRGNGMRWLVDARRSPPAVMWVGYGNPPPRLW